ncbi:unnamed protein product, partial [Owenia fusiformis]
MMETHTAQHRHHHGDSAYKRQRHHPPYGMRSTSNIPRLSKNQSTFTYHRYYWEDVNMRNVTTNYTYTMQNAFLKKSRTRMMHEFNTNASDSHFTVIVVIASIFLFFTLTISGAVVVFCKKRNTVFSLQKSEQDDYEMNSVTPSEATATATEMDSEIGSRRGSMLSRKNSIFDNFSNFSNFSRSSSKYSIIDNGMTRSCSKYSAVDIDDHDSSIFGRWLDEKDYQYEKMVMTSKCHVLHNPGATSESDTEGSVNLNQSPNDNAGKMNRDYYGISGLPSDIESDYDSIGSPSHKPLVNFNSKRNRNDSLIIAEVHSKPKSLLRKMVAEIENHFGSKDTKERLENMETSSCDSFELKSCKNSKNADQCQVIVNPLVEHEDDTRDLYCKNHALKSQEKSFKEGSSPERVFSESDMTITHSNANYKIIETIQGPVQHECLSSPDRYSIDSQQPLINNEKHLTSESPMLTSRTLPQNTHTTKLYLHNHQHPLCLDTESGSSGNQMQHPLYSETESVSPGACNKGYTSSSNGSTPVVNGPTS